MHLLTSIWLLHMVVDGFLSRVLMVLAEDAPQF